MVGVIVDPDPILETLDVRLEYIQSSKDSMHTQIHAFIHT